VSKVISLDSVLTFPAVSLICKYTVFFPSLDDNWKSTLASPPEELISFHASLAQLEEELFSVIQYFTVLYYLWYSLKLFDSQCLIICFFSWRPAMCHLIFCKITLWSHPQLSGKKNLSANLETPIFSVLVGSIPLNHKKLLIQISSSSWQINRMCYCRIGGR
jgi:hypothetical protein